MYDVTALGELLIDFTCTGTDPQGYPTLSAHPGGAPANLLAALSRFGAKTALLGKVGKDTFGRLLTETLKRLTIETRGIITADDVFTTLAFVTLDQNGDREFSFARKPGADTCLRFDELQLSLIEQAKVFHFGSLSLTDEPARSCARQAVAYAHRLGRLVSYDPNLRKPLWADEATAKEQLLWGLGQADVVKISEDEIEFLFGLDAEAGAACVLQDFNARLVFVTCGAEGCFYRNPISCGWVPALKDIAVKDTTGAGDIFGGSALWKLLQLNKAPEQLNAQELHEITAFACTAAGLSTTRSGGITSVPSYEEVMEQLKKL